MRYLTIDKIMMLIAAITGFIFLRKNDRLHIKLVPYYLLVEAAIEITGRYYSMHNKNNLLFYNLFIVFQLTFFTYFFMKEAKNEKVRRILLSTLFILPVVGLVNIFFIQGPLTFNTYSLQAGAILIVILGFSHFYNLFNSPISILREPSFWIVLAVIFFYVSTISVLGLMNNLASLSAKTRYTIFLIVRSVNVFVNLLYIIAFTCRLHLRKSSRSS